MICTYTCSFFLWPHFCSALASRLYIYPLHLLALFGCPFSSAGIYEYQSYASYKLFTGNCSLEKRIYSRSQEINVAYTVQYSAFSKACGSFSKFKLVQRVLSFTSPGWYGPSSHYTGYQHLRLHSSFKSLFGGLNDTIEGLDLDSLIHGWIG